MRCLRVMKSSKDKGYGWNELPDLPLFNDDMTKDVKIFTSNIIAWQELQRLKHFENSEVTNKDHGVFASNVEGWSMAPSVIEAYRSLVEHTDKLPMWLMIPSERKFDIEWYMPKCDCVRLM